jgi:hypothetical protein
MIKQYFALSMLFGSLLIQGCGTTSNLKPAAETGKLDFSAYDRIIVLDFRDETDKSGMSAEKRDNYEKTMEAVSRNFADRLAAQIRITHAYFEVLRVPNSAPGIEISGAITRYQRGNAVARLVIGLGAGSSYFDADVVFSDNPSGRRLGQISTDKNSWFLGGGLAAGQSVEGFMHGAAKKVAKELAAARARQSDPG